MARILVIEDNEPNLELMTYLLGASGHDISSATDGAQGIEMALADFPDLVVLDIQLPDLSGYEVLDRMRRSPNLATVPIIAVTANAMVGDRDQALGAGFDGYLPKPIEPATFARAIDGFLPAVLRGHQPRPQWANRG